MQSWKENVSIYCRIITQGGRVGGGGGGGSMSYYSFPELSACSYPISSLDLLEGKHIFLLS